MIIMEAMDWMIGFELEKNSNWGEDWMKRKNENRWREQIFMFIYKTTSRISRRSIPGKWCYSL